MPEVISLDNNTTFHLGSFLQPPDILRDESSQQIIGSRAARIRGDNRISAGRLELPKNQSNKSPARCRCLVRPSNLSANSSLPGLLPNLSGNSSLTDLPATPLIAKPWSALLWLAAPRMLKAEPAPPGSLGLEILSASLALPWPGTVIRSSSLRLRVGGATSLLSSIRGKVMPLAMSSAASSTPFPSRPLPDLSFAGKSSLLRLLRDWWLLIARALSRFRSVVPSLDLLSILRSSSRSRPGEAERPLRLSRRLLDPWGNNSLPRLSFR